MKRFLFIIAIFLAMVPTFGQSNIVTGEYFIDTDPGTGHGTQINTGAPSTKDSLILNVSVNSLSPGFHVLNYRFRDAAGHWGLTSARSFYVNPPPPVIPNLISGEYFVDTDPGFGGGTAVTVNNPSPDVTVTGQLSASLFNQGQHSLHYRFRDAAGRWSESGSQIFYVQAPVAAPAAIGYGEYFFDMDPGFGSGTSFSFTPNVNLTTAFSIPAVSLPIGFHTLLIRFRDQNGKWSETDSRLFVKVQPDTSTKVVRGEYFFDIDPGAGNGIGFNISNPSSDITLNPTLPTAGKTVNNFHTLHYRFQSQDGKWGFTSSQSFYIADGKEKYYTPINKLEFHVDSNTNVQALRVDSVGLAMHGAKLAYSFGILPQDTLTVIGRHFAWVRGIDFFGTYGNKYNYGEFVITTDTTTGMLLGKTLNPDSTLMTSGLVEIYKDSSGVINLFKSIPIDNTGNFLIGGIPNGSYLFLLKPDLAVTPTAINTYFDQQPQWQMADFQNVNADTMFADVTIKALKTKSLDGLTCLNGFISQSTKKSNGISVSPDKVTGRPMKGASVVLVGKNTKGAASTPSDVIASVVSDDNGYYSFCNVPRGDYNIIIDILGVPLIDYYTVSVDSNVTEKPNLNYEVGIAGIQILEVKVPNAERTLVYPNPSNGELNILFGNKSGMTSIIIVDMTGRQVFNQEINVHSNAVYSFDLHTLGRGMYNLILNSGNSQEVKKIILQ